MKLEICLALVIAYGLVPSPAWSQRTVWTVGPHRGGSAYATVSTHADADVDGDGRLDVSAGCVMNDFSILDNTWPKVEGTIRAMLIVGTRTYDVDATHVV